MPFKPKYKLTNNLLANIAQIERLYGQIEALRVPQKLQLNLKRENLIKSAYASNKIEGNPLTLPEVTNLLLDDRVPVNRDEKEVVNYYEILTDLPNQVDTPITVELVKKLHGLLMQGVDKSAGEIRNEKVVVGKYQPGEKGSFSLKVKHEPPFHKRGKIVAALDDLAEWLEKSGDLPVVVKAGSFHHQFVYLHPFEDGNGRICRLLTALVFLKSGYNINKYFILDDYYDVDRSEYSDKLSSADKGNKTEWLEYFSSGVKYSMQSALAKFRNSMRKLSISERPTAKERQVLEMMQEQPEITSREVAEKFKVSRQQAHNLLSGLVEKDLVERRGSTKSSYYLLK